MAYGWLPPFQGLSRRTPRAFSNAETVGGPLAAGANVVTISAPTAARTATVTLALAACIIAATAPTASLRQVQRLTATANVATATAPTATCSRRIAAGANTATASAPTATRSASTRLAAGAQSTAVTAPAASISAHTHVVATACIATVTAPAAVIVSGAPSLAAGVQTITISAPTATRTAHVDLAAGIQTVTVTAPTAQAGQRQPAGQQTITVTAPTATLRLASALAAGQQTITVTAPTATRTAHVDLAQSANVVTATAPTATAAAHTHVVATANVATVTAPVASARLVLARAAGTQTVTVTAPTATCTVRATLQAGAQTATVTAPTVGVATRVTITAGQQTATLSAPTVTLVTRVVQPLIHEVTVTVADAQLEALHVWMPPTIDATRSVEWMNAVGVAVAGSTITKTAPETDWGYAGACSSLVIASAGYAEFVVQQQSAALAFGLGFGDSNQSYSDIEFHFATGIYDELVIREGLTYRGTFGGVAVGDVLRVSVSGGVVTYYRNGALLYTSAGSPTFPLRADSALLTTGASIGGAVISGDLHEASVVNAPLCEVRMADAQPETLTIGASSVPPSDYPQKVQWMNAVGVSIDEDGALTKTVVNGWGNAGACSTLAISGDGYAEYLVVELGIKTAFGLSFGDTNQDYPDIDFAIQVDQYDNLLIYEGGTYIGTFGAVALDDALRVSVTDSIVEFWRNGVRLYKSETAPTLPLRIDTAIYTQSGTIGKSGICGALIELVIMHTVDAELTVADVQAATLEV